MKSARRSVDNDKPLEFALGKLLQLKRQQIKNLIGIGGAGPVILADIAGPDSFAALVSFLKERNQDDCFIVPTKVVSPFEYGDQHQIGVSACRNLQKIRVAYKCKLGRLILIKAPELWTSMWGRFQWIIGERYRIYSPCPACHVCLHVCRALLGSHLGAKLVVSGERIRHGSLVKINQTEYAINRHARIFDFLDIEHYQPLRYVSSPASKVLRILKTVSLDRHAVKQPSCVCKNGYLDTEGNPLFDEKLIFNYYDDFLMPFAKRVVSEISLDKSSYSEKTLFDIAYSLIKQD